MRGYLKNFSFVLALLLLSLGIASAQHQVEDISDPEQHFLYAAGLMQRKFYDLAEPQLQLFLQRYPTHERAQEAHKLLVHCSHAQGQIPETLAAIESFRKNWPDDPLNEHLTTIQAVIKFTQKDYLAASKCFTELRQSQDPQTVELAIYHLGQCQLELNNYDQALALFKLLADRPLTEGWPYRPYSAYFVGKDAFKKGDNETASAIFAKIVGGKGIPNNIKEDALIRVADLEFGQQNYSAALKYLDEFLVFFPERPAHQYIRLQRTFCFYQLREFAKVVATAADWRKLFPDSENFELDVVQADALCELKRYAEALPLYWQAGLNKANPEKHRQHCLLQAVECLHSLQRYPELLLRGQEFLQEFPNIPEKGSVLFKMGRAAQALQDLDNAEKLYRQSLEFYVGETENYLVVANALLRCLEQAQKWSAGAAVARRISEKIATDQQSSYRLQAATLESQLENWPAVKNDCQFILRNWPEDLTVKQDTLHLLANASIALQEYPQAKQHLLGLQKIAQSDLQGRVALLLAEVMLNLKEDHAAVEILEQARRLPKLPPDEELEITVLLIRIYLSQNNSNAAFPLTEKILAWPEVAKKTLVTPLMWLEIGICHRQKGKFSGAVAALQHAYAQAVDSLLRNSAVNNLAEVYLQLNQFAEAENVLSEIIARNQREDFANSQDLYSLLAEASYALQHYDQAFAAVEKCFKEATDGNLRAITRARWIMARLLFEVEKDPENALPYSIRCFVLANDELYSPKAMELAIRISLALGKEKDAKGTWAELQQRYPAAAAGLQNTSPMQDW